MKRIVTISVLAILAILAYEEFGNVIFCDGSYELPVQISGRDSNVRSVSFVSIDERLVDMVIEQYPSPEPTFETIGGSEASVRVQFGYKQSPLLGREWGYTESFDTILFRIEYTDRDDEFRAVEVPPRFEGDARIELSL